MISYTFPVELMNLPQLVCFDGICVCPKGYQRSDEYCIPKQGANPESHGTMGGASEKCIYLYLKFVLIFLRNNR